MYRFFSATLFLGDSFWATGRGPDLRSGASAINDTCFRGLEKLLGHIEPGFGVDFGEYFFRGWLFFLYGGTLLITIVIIRNLFQI